MTAAGATHVCLRKVEPERIWKLFEDEGVSHYSGAPTIHNSIVNHDSARPLEQRVTVPTGGSPPSPTLLKRMRELNLHPIHLYGLTGPTVRSWAAAGSRSGMSWTSRSRRGRSRARASPTTARTSARWSTTTSTTFRAMADDGRDPAAGNRVMDGYLTTIPRPPRRPSGMAGSARQVRRSPSGVPDGYVELRDRAKDVIISGGENTLEHRGRAGARQAPVGQRGGDRRNPRREVG